MRPTETLADAYPAIQTSLDPVPVEDGEEGEARYILTWIVDDVDTELPGRGQFSLYLSTPETTNIKKSSVATTAILGNISPVGTPSTALTQWLAQSTNMLNTLSDAYNTMEFLHVKFAASEPQANEDINDIVGPWIGIYRGPSHEAPIDYTAYVWNRITGIQSIIRTSGTGAPGTTDTYTITYTDGLTTTYDVVQGNGIASIVRTNGDGTEGSLDTYTITYNNGNTSTFDVQNGIGSYLHIKYSITQPNSNDDLIDTPSAWIGISNTTSPIASVNYLDYDWNPLKSIQSITRVEGDGSPGTTDTYRITFTDTTTQDYSIVHGNGITSIVRTDGDSTEGSLDTYTITYNDGSTSTFNVQNGETAYIHIKYSEIASPGDGDITDDSNNRYIGIYADQNVTASTSAAAYSWTQIRGNSFVPSFYIDENSDLHITIEPEYDGPKSSGIGIPTQNA